MLVRRAGRENLDQTCILCHTEHVKDTMGTTGSTSCSNVVCRDTKDGRRIATLYKGKPIPPHMQAVADNCCHAGPGKRGSLLMQLDSMGNVLNIGEKRGPKLIRDMKHPAFGITRLSGPTYDLMPFGAQRIFGSEPVPAVAIIRGQTGRQDYHYGTVTAGSDDKVLFDDCVSGLSYLVPSNRVATFRDHKVFPNVHCGEKVEYEEIDKAEAAVVPHHASAAVPHHASAAVPHHTAAAVPHPAVVQHACSTLIASAVQRGETPEDWLMSLIKHGMYPHHDQEGHPTQTPCDFYSCLSDRQRDLLVASEMPNEMKVVQDACSSPELKNHLDAVKADPLGDEAWKKLYEEANNLSQFECAEKTSEFVWSHRATRCKTDKRCHMTNTKCADPTLVDYMKEKK